MKDEIKIKALEERVEQKEQELKEKQEELESQRGMLSAAIDELVKNNEILRQRNEELNQLLYQSSHGLKSPVSSIQGVINLLHLEALTPDAKDYLAHIQKKTNQMIDVLHALTSLSKVIKEDISRELINIDSIISTSIQLTALLARKNNVSVSYTASCQEVQLVGNKELLCEILKQVITNALVFRDAGRAGILTISLNKNTEHFVIRVCDDGDGIDASISSSIFEMFYRGSEKSGGIGLGLYIAKKAIELMNGKITFVSSSRGSTFEIYLPNNLNTSSIESAY